MATATFALSAKELQRVTVLSLCVKGERACTSAAELLSRSVRHIKRLKKRLREDGEATIGRSPPQSMHDPTISFRRDAPQQQPNLAVTELQPASRFPLGQVSLLDVVQHLQAIPLALAQFDPLLFHAPPGP
jgi:hypothetical protein